MKDSRDDAAAGPKKALILGGHTGMLGQALTGALQQAGWNAVAQSRDEVDALEYSLLGEYIAQHKPDVVLNAIAYTQVDKAEDEPTAAYTLNRDLPNALGRMAAKQGFRLVHFSTDFVFDGRSSHPYSLSDEPNPLSVYGKSKLAGENALLRAGLPGLLILRTAWLFGPGRKNFVRTILSLAQSREQLGVVHDQIGSPTYTVDLAKYATILLSCQGAQGIFHVVNSGQASWCELAAEAVNLAGLRCSINAITTEEYPVKAPRPPCSILSTEKFTHWTGVTPRPWVQGLREYIFQYVDMADD